MVKLKLFSKNGCKMCEEAKGILLKTYMEGIHLEVYEIDQPSGLAEATFYGVKALPTIILEDENENVIREWRGRIPDFKEILDANKEVSGN